MLLAELLEIHGSQLERVQSVTERWKVDLLRGLLPIQDPLLLHIERDNGKPANSRLAGDASQDRHQGIHVERL